MDNPQASTDRVYEPTADRVLAACEKFDQDARPIEWVLTQLFQKFPENTDFDEVAVKTKVLNILYSTQIRAVNIVARHICSLAIDPDLRAGKPGIVDRIAVVTMGPTGQKRRNYSFASKYCSWHNQRSYPIWDSRVKAYLTWLRQRPEGRFLVKSPDSWTEYAEFVDMMSNLRKLDTLGECSFKQIDKFVYTEGGKLIAEKERLRAAKKDTAASTLL
jgi:hypothetical protein